MQVRVERGGAMACKPENIVVTVEFRPGLRDIALQFDGSNADRFFRDFGKAIGSKCPCCHDQPQAWDDRTGRWQVLS